jgi:hypothetical protein
MKGMRGAQRGVIGIAGGGCVEVFGPEAAGVETVREEG